MDRNDLPGCVFFLCVVALRKESVDRNQLRASETTGSAGSLSARRAWIEMRMARRQRRVASVALRKESVDRNDAVQVVIIVVDASLSARRAWIEISLLD